MTKNSTIDALRALASASRKSETARLREVIDEIESALSAGASRADVLATLHNQGFTMTENSFYNALYRIRKKTQKEGKQGQNHKN